MLAVGAVLVSFEIEGEGDAPEPDVKVEPEPAKPASAAETSAPVPAPVKSPEPAAVSRNLTSGKVLASPAVRARADQLNIDLALVPTEAARVSHADLDAYLLGQPSAQPLASPSPTPQAKQPPASFKTSKDGETTQEAPPISGETRHKVIGLRRVIATRMAESKRHIPHFTYVEEMDVTALEAMRARMNDRRAEDKPKLTVLPLIIRALAVTLVDWPQFNARYEDERGYVSRFEDLNIGIAAQTDGGLIVPVIKAAQDKSVWDLANEILRLAEASRNNQLSTDDLTGATTTLTSLGPLGGIVTTPVINRPEVAIFGPNKIREKLVLNAGEVTARKVMNFSISCDHRVIDGYDAAKMMQELRARIEDPTSIFVL